MISTTLYVDVDTGRVSRTINGPTVTSLSFVLRDIVPLRIAYVQDGAIVTASTLADQAVQRIAVREILGTGDLLAATEASAITGNFAIATLSLATDELVAHFDAIAAEIPSASLWLEVEVTQADGSYRQTLLQLPVTISREGNISTANSSLYVLASRQYDAGGNWIDPHVPAFRSEITGLTGGTNKLDGILTAALPINYLIVIRVDGEISWWVLATSTAATAPGVQRPLDYTTKLWLRVG